MARRFESFLAGSVMLLIGILIVMFLAGLVAPVFLLAFFLTGVGIVFSVMALLK